MKKDSQPPFSRQYYCDTEQEQIFCEWHYLLMMNLNWNFFFFRKHRIEMSL
jgi:hypothetical protein